MDTIVVEGEVAGRRRRRSYDEKQKRRMVAECAEPGASVSLVARKYDVNANLLFTWRRQFAPRTPPSPALDLIPVSVVEAPARVAPVPAEPVGAMEIVLPNGTRVRVDASVDGRALRRVLAAIRAAG